MAVSAIDTVGSLTLPALLDGAAARWPDKPLVTTITGQSLRYGEFAALCERTAAGFAALGISSGDRVAIQLPTSPELIAIVCALHRLGAVAVMANTASTPRELRAVIDRTSSQLAVLGRDVDPGLEREQDTKVLREGSERFSALLNGAPATAPPETLDPHAPATTIFTSGTTAEPKAVTYTHGNHLFSGRLTAAQFTISPSDVVLHHFPLFHMNGLQQLFAVLSAGASMVLAERFRSSEFDRQLDEFRPTITFLNGTHVKMIRAAGTQMLHPSSLRTVPVALQLADEHYDWFEAKYGPVLREMYGLTESVTSCIASPPVGAHRRSCGLASPGYLARLVREDGTDCEPFEHGELTLACSSPHGIIAGYDDNPTATAAALRDGWLHTGDVAYHDQQGFIYWVDRATDIIKRAGENISAKEIEFVLEEHPAVVEAAVIGVPDALREEVPVAFVVLDSDTSTDTTALAAHCRAALTAFKVPTDLHIVPELPHTAVGKVEKKLLGSRER